MRKLVLLFLLAPALFADSFPLTNTRYGQFVPAGKRVLTTNGTDFFMVWSGGRPVRITRLVDGENRVGRPVLQGNNSDFDVVWTGRYFLVVQVADSMRVRLLDAAGEPLGEQFTYAHRGSTARAASDGKRVLVLYLSNTNQVLTKLLTDTGRAEAADPPATVLATDQDAAYDVASNGHGFAAVIATREAISVATWSATGELTSQTTNAATSALRRAALATDGHDYLAVWAENDRLRAMRISGDGVAGVPSTVAMAGAGEQLLAPALAWNGSRYVMTYTSSVDRSVGRWHSAELDPATMGIEKHEEHEAAWPWNGSLASAGGPVRAAWDDATGAARVHSFGGTSGPADDPVASWGAADQSIRCAVSSADRTLVVWSEFFGSSRTLHTGIRLRDGSWREQQIGGHEMPTEAVTDGNGFVLRIGPDLIGLDRDGKKIWQSSGLAVAAITRSGSGYAIVYSEEPSTLGLARVSAAGVVSARVPIGRIIDWRSVSLASSGNGFLVAMTYDNSTATMPYPTQTVFVIRYGPNFERLDPNHLILDRWDGEEPRATWDGSNYRVVWSRYDRVVGRTIPAAGDVPVRDPDFITAAIGYADDLRVASFSGALAVWWSWSNAPAAFIGSVWPRQDDSAVFDARELVQLPDGAIAYVGTLQQDPPPHHGADRILMLRRGAAGPVPDAPTLTVRPYNGQLRIEWTAPPQPVAGYRVEYRIGNGSWNEMPRWYDADERLAPWTSVKAGQTYAFRVRAWSENGTSAYSTPATAYIGRRRAVR
jgi:hypothetical protein